MELVFSCLDVCPGIEFRFSGLGSKNLSSESAPSTAQTIAPRLLEAVSPASLRLTL